MQCWWFALKICFLHFWHDPAILFLSSFWIMNIENIQSHFRGFHQLHSHMRVIGSIGHCVPMQQPTQQMWAAFLPAPSLEGTGQSLEGGWLRTYNWSSFFREQVLSKLNLKWKISPRPEHNMVWQGCRWETIARILLYLYSSQRQREYDCSQYGGILVSENVSFSQNSICFSFGKHKHCSLECKISPRI